MHSRRRVLRALAPGAALCVAGCSDGVDGDDSLAGTPTATASPSPTRRPGPAPAARVLGASATAADGTRVTARRWTAFASVSYEGEDGTASVDPERGRYLAYDFTIENTGDERLPAVRDTVFRLQLAGGIYRHLHSLRGVPFDRLRQPDGAPGIRPLVWYDGLAPGESVRLQLVFDVPHRPRFRHYLAWDHPEPVVDTEGVVSLWPGGADDP
ncbi:hypothetical protein [Haloglomus litoreum]|uniref:hypothetical protein n=1 Tax=Haloglomus litoreum TaxID=3034026 RepID=UPI0023E76A2D|nr:hypothetical protein [Haloglomus sp. DT116]